MVATDACGSTAKKAEFLRWLVEELALKDVEVVAQRAEQLAREPGLREGFDVATARALGPLSTVLELTLPFCRIGGTGRRATLGRRDG